MDRTLTMTILTVEYPAYAIENTYLTEAIDYLAEEADA